MIRFNKESIYVGFKYFQEEHLNLFLKNIFIEIFLIITLILGFIEDIQLYTKHLSMREIDLIFVHTKTN